ncbi:uncharacterized protein A4U43_UnF2310 [Asparagus officinalis]|uniref:Uncharacterized protein n=1 Tax=Asparagus officinalis TaxID=4686 RepID=A0A1R3L7A4_ASPOF|nr:uncharacterized protein A4U43_UnF2310 [Asparagus officinalis]
MVPSASAGSPGPFEPIPLSSELLEVPQSSAAGPDRIPELGSADAAESYPAGLLRVHCGTRPLGAQSCYNCNKLPRIGIAAMLSGPADGPSYGDPDDADPCPAAGVLLSLQMLYLSSEPWQHLPPLALNETVEILCTGVTLNEVPSGTSKPVAPPCATCR